MSKLDAAARAADIAATLLHSLVPPEVRRAEQLLTNGSSASSAACEAALRTLLEFHQDVVSPVSSAFSFALPCGAALRAIGRHAPAGVIEAGAGNGLWAALIRTSLPVHASDCAPPECAWDDELRVMPTRDTASHAAAALLLCWPPLELEVPDGSGESSSRAMHASNQRWDARDQKWDGRNRMAVEELAAFRGSTLIYVGEWRGHTGLLSALSDRTAEYGQTGGEVFQTAVGREWELLESVRLPRWPGFTDRMLVFQRKWMGGACGGSTPSTEASAASADAAAVAAAATGRAGMAARLKRLASLGLTQRAAVAAAVMLQQFLVDQ